MPGPSPLAQQDLLPATRSPEQDRLIFDPSAPWLAPLAGYSDLPFRLLCREYGARVACTEMVSAKGMLHQSGGTRDLLNTTAADAPLVVQLFGAVPQDLSRAVALLLERGFRFFDLNAGCPVRKVVKSGAGSALMQTPEVLVAAVRAMADLAGPGCVGVKIRSGWNRDTANALDLAPRLEEAGAAWITLHPRTTAQGFSGQADWDQLARLKALVRVPVLASGDLLTPVQAVDCLRRTGVDGVMLARGALSDPAIFGKFTRLWTGGAEGPWTTADLTSLIRRHADLTRRHGRGKSSLLKMRTFVPRYIKGVAGSRSLRKEFQSCTSWELLDSLLAQLLTLSETGELD